MNVLNVEKLELATAVALGDVLEALAHGLVGNGVGARAGIKETQAGRVGVVARAHHVEQLLVLGTALLGDADHGLAAARDGGAVVMKVREGRDSALASKSKDWFEAHVVERRRHDEERRVGRALGVVAVDVRDAPQIAGHHHASHLGLEIVHVPANVWVRGLVEERKELLREARERALVQHVVKLHTNGRRPRERQSKASKVSTLNVDHWLIDRSIQSCNGLQLDLLNDIQLERD